MAAAQFTQVMPLTGMTIFLLSIAVFYHKGKMLQSEKKDNVRKIKRFLIVKYEPM